MFGISAPAGTSLTTVSGLENLITQFTAVDRQPITRLQVQKDDLKIQRAIYDDVQSNLAALRSAIQDLRGNSSIFGSMAVTSSDTDVLGASGDNEAAAATYDLTVKRLAQSHRLTSAQQAQSDEALGLSGTFVMGGATARAVASKNSVTNTVTDFSTGGTILDDETELGSGEYFVEVRNQGSWQFRLVDENGDAVRIAKTTNRATLTAGWQDIDDVAGQTFDTGRGLKISLGAGAYTAGLRNGGAASVDYTAAGASITVSSSDTLNDIREAINGATYAKGNEVTASVVDRTLVLANARTGEDARIDLADSSGSVLSSLGLLNRSALDGDNLASDQGVTTFGTASLVSFSGGDLSGQSELAAGRYFVEVGSGVNADKFRLLDSGGNVVPIANTSAGTTATSGSYWLDISAGSYDTGRGLTITFQGGSYAPTTFGTDAAEIYFDPANAIRAPRNASLEVNGLNISRIRNTGLNDVVDNLTFDLRATGSTQVAVGNDNETVISRVKTLLGKLNDTLAFIKSKTESEVDEDASALSDNTIYKRGPLADDFSLTTLRRNLVSDMFSQYAGAAQDAPSLLADIGVTLSDSGLSFELSAESALSDALNTNFQNVADLFDDVLAGMEDRLAGYLDGTSAIVASTQAGIDDEIERIDGRVASAEARLKVREDALRRQFQSLQTQLFDWQRQQQEMQSFMLGSLLNKQG